jgi:hypothetical protein
VPSLVGARKNTADPIIAPEGRPCQRARACRTRMALGSSLRAVQEMLAAS